MWFNSISRPSLSLRHSHTIRGSFKDHPLQAPQICTRPDLYSRRVTLPNIGSKSWAGFVTVDKSYLSNLWCLANNDVTSSNVADRLGVTGKKHEIWSRPETLRTVWSFRSKCWGWRCHQYGGKCCDRREQQGLSRNGQQDIQALGLAVVPGWQGALLS